MSYDSLSQAALSFAAHGLIDPRVLRKAPHAPLARIASFGDTGVNIELGAFVADASVDVLALRGAIQREILRTLDANGIALAYPRRDIHVTGIEPPPPQPSPRERGEGARQGG
ncbi:MAG TPA: hypothetical protein VH542_04200 [Steroidobacteraceae bacterium]